MATKSKVDTPRDGRTWCDVVNSEPLPPTMVHMMTLEHLIAAQRNGGPLNVSVMHDIIQQQEEEKRARQREDIWRRLRG